MALQKKMFQLTLMFVVLAVLVAVLGHIEGVIENFENGTNNNGFDASKYNYTNATRVNKGKSTKRRPHINNGGLNNKRIPVMGHKHSNKGDNSPAITNNQMHYHAKNNEYNAMF